MGKEQKMVDMKLFLNYDSISDKIVYKLANPQQNRELLEDIPYVEFLDLVIIFQCLVTSEPVSTSYILVHNVHLRLWDVTVDDLLKIANENTPRLMGYEFKSMKDVLLEIMESKSPEKSDTDACLDWLGDGNPMYVLSTKSRIAGATCILYPMLLSDICEKLKSSFYIIPSSIHEVLILPADNTDEGENIRAIIKEVNDTQVALEDVLSYSLYYYERDGYRLYRVE